jgi:hypothetical protein
MVTVLVMLLFSMLLLLSEDVYRQDVKNVKRPGGIR